MRPWENLIERATAEAQVVAIARDYLATVTPQELATLPERYRPGAVKGAEDIEDCYYHLAEAYFDRAARDEAILDRMLGFFRCAALRLSQLRDETLPPVDAAAQPDRSQPTAGQPPRR